MVNHVMIAPPPPPHYCPVNFPNLATWATEEVETGTLICCSECNMWWYVGWGEYSRQYKKVRWYHLGMQQRISQRMGR